MSDLGPRDVSMGHGPRILRLVSVDKAGGSAILGKGPCSPLLVLTIFVEQRVEGLPAQGLERVLMSVRGGSETMNTATAACNR